MLWLPFVHAQKTIVSGTVRDAKNKEGLPMAGVYFLGSTVGVVADIDGNFYLESELPFDSISFTFLGYAEKKLHIQRNQTQTLDILLVPQENTLETATITAGKRKKLPKDTFAMEVWHEIIAHKAENQRIKSPYLSHNNYVKTQFDVYKAGVVRKLPLFNRKRSKLNFVPRYIQNDGVEDYLPSLIKETVTDVYHRTNPKKRKEIVVSDRMSGVDNQFISQNAEVYLYDINLYENVITVMDKSFVSPFGNTGNITYRYFITDSVVRNGDMYYKMDFWGKSPQDLAFAGTAWIHKPTYAIEQTSFEIPRHANINYVHRYKVKQQYQLLPDGTWFRQFEDTEIVLALWQRKNKEPFSVVCRKIDNAYNINITQSMPDSLFEGSKSEWKKDAYHTNDSVWTATRPTPLTGIEQGIYNMVDSIRRTPAFKNLYGGIYTLTSGYIPANKLEIGRVAEMVSWNGIEGTRLKFGLRTSAKFSRKLSMSGYLAYGTKDHQVKGGAAFSWNIPNSRNLWRNIRAEYRHDYTFAASLNQMLTYDNIVSSLTRRTPLTKLMKMQTAEVSYGHTWIAGLDNTLALRHRIYYATPNNGFDFSNGQQILDKFSVSEVQLSTHWGPGEVFFSNGANARKSVRSKLPVFYLDYKLRYIDNFLNQNLVNHQFDFRIRHRWNWFLGYTRYTITASKIFGQVPYPLMTTHQGNGSYLYNRNAFNMMNESEFMSDTYASLIFDHHFDGFFLNKIPLVRKLRFREIFTFRGVYGTIDQRNTSVLKLPDGIQQPNLYMEMGFGLENIAQMFRVDFVWRMTHLDQPNVSHFGIKFAFQPKF